MEQMKKFSNSNELSPISSIYIICGSLTPKGMEFTVTQKKGVFIEARDHYEFYSTRSMKNPIKYFKTLLIKDSGFDWSYHIAVKEEPVGERLEILKSEIASKLLESILEAHNSSVRSFNSVLSHLVHELINTHTIELDTVCPKCSSNLKVVKYCPHCGHCVVTARNVRAV